MHRAAENPKQLVSSYNKISSINVRCVRGGLLCEEGFFWNGSECANPCDLDPCSSVANSTGLCTAYSSSDYGCGCLEGYNWRQRNCEIIPKVFGNICTGKTSCYSGLGEEVPCPLSIKEDSFGQDACYATQKVCVPQSFTVQTISNKNVVVDNNTGLIWQQTIPTDEYKWDIAVSYCNSLTYAGYDDWRLSSLKELLTIVDYGRGEPPEMDTTYFPDSTYAQSKSYTFWSSTTAAVDTSYAWYMSFKGGMADVNVKTDTPCLVRCVR